MRYIASILALAPCLVLSACGPQECTLADCESTIRVTYGSVVVNEPYTLSINPNGPTTSVVCLDNGPDTEPLPDWLECDANGFELTGDFADLTTITVAVIPVSTEEPVVANALVPLTVSETIEPNGPDCGPVCYVREGSTEGLG